MVILVAVAVLAFCLGAVFGIHTFAESYAHRKWNNLLRDRTGELLRAAIMQSYFPHGVPTGRLSPDEIRIIDGLLVNRRRDNNAA